MKLENLGLAKVYIPPPHPPPPPPTHTHSIAHKVYSDMAFVYCKILHDKVKVRVIYSSVTTKCKSVCYFMQLGNSVARRGLVYLCFLMILAWYCWTVVMDLVLMCRKEKDKAVSHSVQTNPD